MDINTPSICKNAMGCSVENAAVLFKTIVKVMQVWTSLFEEEEGGGGGGGAGGGGGGGVGGGARRR